MSSVSRRLSRRREKFWQLLPPTVIGSKMFTKINSVMDYGDGWYEVWGVGLRGETLSERIPAR